MPMDAMGDALKRKAGALKGPGLPSEDLMDKGADDAMESAGGEIDLSKIDPKIIEAVAKMLQSGDSVNVQKLGSSAGEVPDGSDRAPSLGGGDAPVDRNAVLSAIADGGSSGDSGSLRARAAAGAKSHMAHMGGKHK